MTSLMRCIGSTSASFVALLPSAAASSPLGVTGGRGSIAGRVERSCDKAAVIAGVAESMDSGLMYNVPLLNKPAGGLGNVTE